MPEHQLRSYLRVALGHRLEYAGVLVPHSCGGNEAQNLPIPRRHAQSESKSEAVAAASSLAWRSAFLCVGIDASQKIELKVADDRRRHMLGVGLAEHQVRS